MRGLKIQAGSGSRLYPSGSLISGDAPIPPIPAFDNVEGCWALFNWNPVGYVEGQCFEGAVDGACLFLGTEPYENNWATLAGGDQDLANWQDSSPSASSFYVRGTNIEIQVANKQIHFRSTGGLRGGNVGASTTKTYYALFRIDNLATTDQILFEIGEFDGLAEGSFRLWYVGSNTLRASFRHDAVGGEIMVNATLSDTDWHLVCVTLDSAAGTLINQFAIYLDNVAGSTNVSNTSSTPTASATIYVGGSSSEAWSFNGKMRMIRVNNQVDSPAVRTEMYERVQYLQSIT